METAGDSGNLKWRLLGYKLPQRAFSVKTKGCHLAGRKSYGGRSGGNGEKPGLPKQGIRIWPGSILFLVLFQGSESHSPHRGCCLQDMNIRLEWGLFWAWILVLSQLCCLAQTVWQRGEDSHWSLWGLGPFLHCNWTESHKLNHLWFNYDKAKEHWIWNSQTRPTLNGSHGHKSVTSCH